MYALSNGNSHREDDLAIKRKTMFNNADIERYLVEQNTDNERSVKKNKFDNLNADIQNTDKNPRSNTHPIVRILERKYPLTVTGYKYLNIGINATLPSYVDVILGDCHGKEISLSPDTWKEILEHKRTILALLQYDENKRIRAPLYIGNLTLRFGRINNLPILRLETPTARLSMSKSTVLNMFNLEYCINRLISSLTAITDSVDIKLSRLLDIASTVAESANMLKTMYNDESFDRNDIIECELIALVFGEH